METTHLAECAPKAVVNVTVRSARPREYLTEREIDKLIEAAKRNRWDHRDVTAILLAYRHGLRASELVLQALGRASGEVVADTGQNGPLTRRIYDSYISDVAEHSYLDAFVGPILVRGVALLRKSPFRNP